MTTEQKPDLQAVLASYGVKVKGKMALCPFHDDHTPSLSVDGEFWYCHAGCGDGDVYSFIAKTEHIDIKADFPTIKKIAFEKAGESMPERTKERKPTSARPATIPGLDLEAARRTMNDPKRGGSGRAYLGGRGFKRETWERFGFGLCLEGRYRDRVIIPIGKGGYFTTRAIRDAEPKVLHAAGPIPELFNVAALERADSVFLAESPFDALTLIQAGFEAVGLLGLESLKPEFLTRFEGKEVLLVTDNDEAGIRARAKIELKLSEAGATVQQVYIMGEKHEKDINDIFRNTPDLKKFQALVTSALDKAEQDRARQLGDEDYLKNEFLKPREPANPISTGFKHLDEKLSGLDENRHGGFLPGVAVLGGETSIGKTALAVHFTIKAAEHGKRVLYLSYELSKTQMWARIFGTTIGMPYRDILRDPRESRGCKPEQIVKLENLAKHIRVEEETKFEDLQKKIQDAKELQFSYNLIVVDYLQRMPDLEGEKSRERRIQIANLVHRLQADIARENDTTILILSSYSRSATETGEPAMNYMESGDIEYTAQVAMSLYAEKGWRDNPEPELILRIYKNTLGETGQIKLHWIKRTGFFSEE